MSDYNTWVSTWGSAVSIGENRPEQYARNITLRYHIKSAFDGDGLTFTLDNYCGTEAVTFTSATVLLGESFYPVTFGGKSSVTVAAGLQITTDPVNTVIHKGDDISISIYLGEFTQMRSAVYLCGELSNNSQYGIGDMTKLLSFPIDQSKKTNIFYFLSNVSIHTTSNCHALVCYGDSITAQNWPDDLTLRCIREKIPNVSIIRKATSGSRVLREYSCITYESYGLKGTNRFLHEVPTDGATAVLIQQGINDIIHPVGTDINPFRPMSDLPTAEELIEGLKYYISCARQLGLKVYMGTLLPIEGWRTYAPFRDELRCAINEWIRTTDLIDGVADFDKAVCDAAHPAKFGDGCDSGDHLHPSAEGYRRMAEAVPTFMLE